MLRRIVIAAAFGLLLAAPAAAQTRTLMPGVTYEKMVQFTPHGPVALHVVTGPRPDGLYALLPVLSNETIVGRETVTSMQKRLSSSATAVGVNADFFAPDTGRPSGVLMRNGIVASPPYGDRSSVGIAVDGTLDIRRVEFFGTWRGLGQRRALTDMNQAPGPNGISLFTDAYGPATPPNAGVTEVVIAPLPASAPNTDLVGPVIQAGTGGTPIPPGGAVLVARGTAAQRLAEEAPVGTFMTLRVIFRPEWTGILNAVGGGPVIVRNSGPVFRSNEAFTSYQLGPRHPRTAIGQLADGRIRLVVVDGRRPGYSVGMTNFELAQAMARLGAVTASAFDAGGSSTLAFNGELLNRPSDRTERPVSNSLQLMYYGVYAPEPDPVISPNGDGVGERQRELSYKVVRPSTVIAALVAPSGEAVSMESLTREPGTYPVAFPPAPLDPLAEPVPPAEGRWRLDVTATDDLGRVSTTSQAFTVNSTLGFAKLSRRNLVVRVRGKQTIQAGVTLTRAARVLATVETASGVQVAAIALRRLEAGRFVATWKGRTLGGRSLAYGGSYVIRFRATNELGSVDLTTPAFRVIRAAPVPLKKPKPKR